MHDGGVKVVYGGGPIPMDEGRESEHGPELPIEPTGQVSDRRFSRVRVCIYTR